MSRQDFDPSAGHKFEAIFSLFLVALAFLSRDNNHLVTPWVYVFFLFLLVMNLVAGYVLRHWPSHPWLSTMIILANCGIVTGIVQFSGGAESNLWVLYLLPVFTACMFLERQQVMLVTAGTLSFNLIFYAGQDFFSDDIALFQAGVKTATLFFAAAMTWLIAHREKRIRTRLDAQRKKMTEIEDKIQTQKLEFIEMEKLADVGQISAGVAHDLNNPLTVIIGTVKVLLEDDETRVPLRQDLERVLRSANLCHNITMNLLDMAKGSAFVQNPIEIPTLVESTLQIYGEVLSEHNIQVVCDITPGLPPVLGSETQMQRVLLNLLVNARGAMKHGGEIKISVTAGGPLPPSPAASIQLMVEDTGPGISSDFMQKIFKPFNTTKKASEGTGLGLYLSREIVLRHGGQLTVENKSQGGARFIIRLPMSSELPSRQKAA